MWCTSRWDTGDSTVECGLQVSLDASQPGPIRNQAVRDEPIRASTTRAGADLVSEFEVVGQVDEFADGEGRAVVCDDRMVAVFRIGADWYAMDDLCRHMGASLAEGFVAKDTVTCPWHAWQFSIKDGTWVDSPATRVECFEVKIDGDNVMVRTRPSAGLS